MTKSNYSLLAVALCVVTLVQPLHASEQTLSPITVYGAIAAGICTLGGYVWGARQRYTQFTSQKSIKKIQHEIRETKTLLAQLSAEPNNMVEPNNMIKVLAGTALLLADLRGDYCIACLQHKLKTLEAEITLRKEMGFMSFLRYEIISMPWCSPTGFFGTSSISLLGHNCKSTQTHNEFEIKRL